MVGSLAQSLPFYTGLLGPLGYVTRSEITGERGERVVYLGPHGGLGQVGLRERRSEAGGPPYDRYGIGLHHLAFAVSRRSVVDEVAAWAPGYGAEIESGPCDYDYAPGYYALFLHDPDGMKLEIVHCPRERDLAAQVRELSARLAALEGGGYSGAPASHSP